MRNAECESNEKLPESRVLIHPSTAKKLLMVLGECHHHCVIRYTAQSDGTCALSSLSRKGRISRKKEGMEKSVSKNKGDLDLLKLLEFTGEDEYFLIFTRSSDWN